MKNPSESLLSRYSVTVSIAVSASISLMTILATITTEAAQSKSKTETILVYDHGKVAKKRGSGNEFKSIKNRQNTDNDMGNCEQKRSNEVLPGSALERDRPFDVNRFNLRSSGQLFSLGSNFSAGCLSAETMMVPIKKTLKNSVRFRIETLEPRRLLAGEGSLVGDALTNDYFSNSLIQTTGTDLDSVVSYPSNEVGDELVTLQVAAATGVGSISGELKQWHKITLDFVGPSTSETATVNPFTDYRLDVTFTHQDTGKSYVVPGYYAADGDAANTSSTSGNVWRVHFAPSEIGSWDYTTSFRKGSNVAVDDNPLAGTSAGFFDNESGSFLVDPSDKTGRDLRGKGRLEYVGERYLQFAGSGEYFLKQGADAPENLLAYEDFDNTTDVGGRRKSYTAHAGDWNPTDPSWQNGKGTELIGAINYLASEGLNAFSFLPMNIDGDDKNVFPYLSKDAADRTRIDVSKLDQWEIVFEHATSEGFFLHFKTQETENDHLLDGGDLGTERKLYYRELIARFSHNLALNWNLGEENTNTTQQQKDFAQYFHDNDPYQNLIVLHTYPGQKDQVYDPLLGDASKLTGASLQTSSSSFLQVHSDTVKWVNESAAAGKPWAIAVDEPGDAQHALRPDNNKGNSHEDGRKNALWGTLMGGGYGNEWYFGYAYDHSDLTLEDFRSRDDWWDYTRYALEFFNDNDIPFWDMQNDNSISTASNDYGFYEAGEVYVGYLKEGGTTSMDLSAATGQLEVKWFDPRNGGDLQDGSVTTVMGGDSLSVGQAPNSTNQDWVVLVRKPLIVEQGPFGQTPEKMEDGSIIQFENYDVGGEGIAYHDSDAISQGNHNRDTAVDGGAAAGAVGERISSNVDGEWLEYTVDVTAGTYYTTIRYASGSSDAVGSLRLLIGDGPDGENFTELGIYELNNTGGWSNWDFLTLPGITTSGGDGMVLRAEVIGGNFDLDFIEFTTGVPVNNPPTVTIDEVTEVIVDSTGTEGVYQEQGGLVVMEMENTSSHLALWNEETTYANFTGEGYLQFTGNSPTNGPATSPLEYKFTVNQPGLYYLHLHAARDTTHGQASDHSNDAYVRVEGDYNAGPNPGNTHGDDAPLSMLMSDTKFFGGNADTFVWASGNRLDPGGETNKRVAVYDFKAGEEYTLVVSGRSQYFAIDRIMFRHESVSVGTAQNLTTPESSQTGLPDPNLVAAYQIDATVTDDARPTYPPALQWTKVSGPGEVSFDDPNAEDVLATFSLDGTYVLRLTADDGDLSSSDAITVTIETPIAPSSFTPIEDAYIENGTKFNNQHLKVEDATRTRTSYLKFDVSSLDASEISSATLRLNVDGDAGSGPINVSLGSHNNWTEANLTNSNKPLTGAELDSITGTHSLGQWKEFNVTSAVNGNGILTFVIEIDGGNDVWFSSSEGILPPELVIELSNPSLLGDYNRDGTVDQADHSFWATSYGGTSGVSLQADGNNDGVVDAADYTIWRDNLGATTPPSSAATQSNSVRTVTQEQKQIRISAPTSVQSLGTSSSPSEATETLHAGNAAENAADNSRIKAAFSVARLSADKEASSPLAVDQAFINDNNRLDGTIDLLLIKTPSLLLEETEEIDIYLNAVEEISNKADSELSIVSEFDTAFSRWGL